MRIKKLIQYELFLDSRGHFSRYNFKWEKYWLECNISSPIEGILIIFTDKLQNFSLSDSTLRIWIGFSAKLT